jgi:hypothetical protein
VEYKNATFTFELKYIKEQELNGRNVGLLKPMLALQCFGQGRTKNKNVMETINATP